MSAAIAVLPHAKVHMRPLQMQFLKQFHPHKQKIHLTPAVKTSLLWWTAPTNILGGGGILFAYSKSYSNNGSFPGWVGSPYGQQSSQWPLVPRLAAVPYQSLRTQGNPAHDPSLPSQAVWPPQCNSFRQHHSSQLCQSPRRDGLEGVMQTSLGNMETLHCECQPHCTLQLLMLRARKTILQMPSAENPPRPTNRN